MADGYEVPNPKAIGLWLDKNQGDNFAKATYKQEEYEAEEPFYQRGLFGASIGIVPQYRTVTKYRKVVSGFDSTADIPFKSVHLIAEPTLHNIPWWKWHCVFIVSKAYIRCFVTHLRLREVNWNERTETGNIDWRIEEFVTKDVTGAKKKIEDLLDQFADSITRYLMEKYGLTQDSESE